MKTLNFSLVLFSLICFTIYGFKEDELNDNILSQNQTEVVNSNSKTRVQKSTNPYASVGTDHNAGLDYLINNESDWFIGGSAVTAEVDSSLVDHFVSLVIDYPGLNEDSLRIVLHDFYNYMQNEEANFTDINTTISGLSFSTTAKNYLTDMFSLSGSNYTTTMNSLNTIESDIIADSFENRDEVLMVIAVLKSSYSYWNTAFDDPTNDWNNHNDAGLSAWSVAKDDAKGALFGGVGAAIGGTPALVFGPGGYVLTIAGGAVRGAIVGSAYSIISSWFD